MTDDLVERVARALAESEGHKWLPWFSEQYGDDYRSSARAIIPLVLEHAAKAVDDVADRVRAKVYAYPQCQPNEALALNRLADAAAAIRGAA